MEELDLPRLSVAKSSHVSAKSSPPLMMLSLVKKDGSRTAFPYSHLCRVDFDGVSEIRLQFPDDVVTLRGEVVGRIFAALQGHCLAEVVESDALRSRKNGDAVVAFLEIRPAER